MQAKAIRRRILGLLLGVQLVGALVPLADARLERPRADAVHIEEPGSDACDPVHVHADCVLCQHLVVRPLPGEPCVVPAVPALATPAHPGSTDERPAHRTVALERGRSPPLV